METKKVRILLPEWHTSYAYELTKLPNCEFTLWNWGGYRYKTWQRPFPKGVKFTEEPKKEDYDLMIIGFDNYMDSYKMKPLNWARENNINRVIIYHGCPLTLKQAKESREILKDETVVCNLPEVERRLKVKDSTTILAGIDPEEWKLTDYSKGVCCTMPHDFGGQEYANGKSAYDMVCQDVYVENLIDFNCTSFEEYKNRLAKYSIFFNPTYGSANPRTRIEAMMCGLVVVSPNLLTKDDLFFGYEDFAFFENSPYKMAEKIRQLVSDKEKCIEMGKKAREFAVQTFNINRFLEEWKDVIRKKGYNI